MSIQTEVKLKAKDFKTDQEVRWCPGCGDYAILAALQRVLPTIGVKRENVVMVSGIGCAARFPYYMNTYGMHSIHGRAPAFATGIKVSNPDLSVWVISGDGDALSIGGNHLIHVLRRNVNVNILLFNNRIYGLTKGQTSPTSPMGRKTKTTPFGSAARPVNPLALAMGAGATFVARGVDRQIPHLSDLMRRAHEHQGTSFIEIMQNCNIFNDGAFDHFTGKDVKDDRQLVLEHGKPLIFGKDRDQGIRSNGFGLEVVSLAEVDESEILIHDAHRGGAYAFALASLTDYQTDLPVPIGVLQQQEGDSYEALLHQVPVDQDPDLQALVTGDAPWTVG